MPKATPIDLLTSFDALTRLPDRSPTTSEQEAKDSFKMLSGFRDGGAFISTFSGMSEWERHANGDEFVFAVEGSAEVILLIDGNEIQHRLQEGELIIVPQNTWHRFETTGVKLLTLTPQPTDHHSGSLPPS